MSALKENPDLFQPYAAIGCELPNKACTGRLGLCAFFELFPKPWQFSVSEPCSPQPPVTRAVGPQFGNEEERR